MEKLSAQKFLIIYLFSLQQENAGGSLGAALVAYYLYFNKQRKVAIDEDRMKGSYLGPSYSNMETEQMAKKYDAIYEKLKEEELYERTAEKLAEGSAVGWMQGRMEFGPRALGARSILADPRNPEMQRKLNLKIKKRESFRPFAPSVLYEDCQKYFNSEHKSPYMLMVHPVRESILERLTEKYMDLDISAKFAGQKIFLAGDKPMLIFQLEFRPCIKQPIHDIGD